MRKLLNLLAVIIGLAGTLMAVGGTLVFGAGIFAFFKGGTPFPAGLSPMLLLVTLAGLAFLGFLIAARMLLHLRHPDLGTAKDVVGIATYLAGLELLNILAGRSPHLLPQALHSPVVELLLFVSALVGCYLFYRLVMTRIAERIFPVDTAAGSQAGPADPPQD